MQENRKRLLKSVYTVCFSILTAVVGLLFIVQAWSIFRSAERGAFTPSRISEHFNEIAVPVFFWVVALIVNIVLGYVYPDGKERPKAYFEGRERVNRLKKRLPKDAVSLRRSAEDVVGAVVLCHAVALAAAALIVSLVYLLDKSYSPVLSEQLFVEHDGATDRLLRALVWCGGAAMLVAAAVLFDEYLSKKKEEKIKREIAENAVKKKQSGEKTVAAETEEKKNVCKCAKFFGSNKFVWGVRAAVGVVGIVFVITGVTNGGMASVLEKAIKICTQCIGLG